MKEVVKYMNNTMRTKKNEIQMPSPFYDEKP